MTGAVRQAFSNARTGPVAELPPRSPAKRPSSLQVCLRRADVSEARLQLGWAIPAMEHVDTPALDLLAAVLGGGESSRLVRRLQRELGLVNEVSAGAWTPQDPGLFVLSATMPPERICDAVTAILAELRACCRAPVDVEELLRVQRQVEVDGVFQRETAQGRAKRLGYYEAMAGGIDAEERYLERMAACTPERLRAVAERYLSGDMFTMALVVGEGVDVNEDRLRAAVIAAPPVGARTLGADTSSYVRLSHKTRGGGAGQVLREELPGGVTLLVRPESAVPMVSLRAAWMGGLRAESAADNGISSLLARSLTRGTRQWDAKALGELLDGLGGNFGGSQFVRRAGHLPVGRYGPRCRPLFGAVAASGAGRDAGGA